MFCMYHRPVYVAVFFFFFKQKTAYEMLRSLVGSEMCIRDSRRTDESEALAADSTPSMPPNKPSQSEAAGEGGMPTQEIAEAKVKVAERNPVTLEMSIEPRVRWLLYTSHFFAAWGERSWEFGASLLLLSAAGGNSFALTAAFGAAECASTVLFGGMVGSYIDRAHPLQGPLFSFLIQNVSIALSAGCVVILLSVSDLHHTSSSNQLGRAVTIAGVMIFGATARLGSLGSTLSVEKGWAVALTRGMAPKVLADLNGSMRRIDLMCKILAPITVGILIDNLDGATAGVWIAVFNLLAWVVEAGALKKVFATHEHLFQIGDPEAEEEDLEEPAGTTSCARKCSLESGGALLKEFKHGWATYYHQEVFLAALGLATVYFTVLSFGTLMTAYVNWRGMPGTYLGIARGCGAAFGIVATIVTPIMVHRLGARKAGLVSIWVQLMLLLPCFLSTAVSDPLAELSLLIGGVVVSRLGLWGFDLAVTQLLQTCVLETELGAVNGVQGALQNFFGMGEFVLGMVFPDPEQFWILIISSWLSVLCAACLYTIFFGITPSVIAAGTTRVRVRARPLVSVVVWLQGLVSGESSKELFLSKHKS
eukprot:TRINITY_DN13060_c0_g4_i4.p1 TRINITY_DN13060_c0_g4~~TRINITY_DN13060_c0_g4_i4.p1  ORF type:complete len:591 (-),score=103.94 TRINITY_DN13060_c0_g4_i4:452-2224(-)